ncbi:hypothetical protein CRE_30490 [Caenorhabditis remanei]|uniref:Uncharacterized protein n=1 Tax=Caenorhabditis remanei TaxID=31234 RepID=E3NI57_CAERE|nr:hypothetical protein CRE_30490 [Caenorhabditis remanei]
MLSPRERRDSETSTDSWSLVEEDRLDDDFSLNSTDNEGAELETAEPIVEEPITSDEDEDTASEKSLDSESEDSEDSDVSVDSESEEEEESDVEQEEDDIVEEGEIAIQEESEDDESEDSDLSDEEEIVEEIIAETDDMETEEAIRTCKEHDYWLDEEVQEDPIESRRVCRMLLAVIMFFMIFPLADIFTSWILTYQNHRLSHGVQSDLHMIDSLQSYPSMSEWITKIEEESAELRKWRRKQRNQQFQKNRSNHRHLTIGFRREANIVLNFGNVPKNFFFPNSEILKIIL